MVEEVRITLDENQAENSYLQGSTDNMELDEIIRAKLADAVRAVVEMCPAGLLDGVPMEGDALRPIPAADGSGSLVLPDDFLRLVSFKLRSWGRAVTTASDEGSATDHLQRNPYTRGTPLKPVCILSHNAQGRRTLEYFTAGCHAEGGYDHTVERALYVPLPVPTPGTEGDTLVIPHLLRPAIVYYCAGLVELTRGNTGQGDTFLKLATSNFNNPS